MFPPLHQLFDKGRLRHVHFMALDDVWFGDIVEKGTQPGEFLVEAWNEDDVKQNFRVQCEADLEEVNYDETLLQNLRRNMIKCHAIIEGGGKDLAVFAPKSTERTDIYFEINPTSWKGYASVIVFGLILVYVIK